MDLTRFLNQGGSVKIETTADDLLRFAEFILERYSKENKVSKILPEYGGIELAVEITGYSKSSIYTFVNKKKIPFKKVHGKIWFQRSELIHWLDSGNIDNKLIRYIK